MDTYTFQAFPICPEATLYIGGSSFMCPRVQDKRFFHPLFSLALKHSTTRPVFSIILT